MLRGNNGEHRANLRSNTASVLLEYYPDIDEEYRAVLEKYAYYRKSMKYRLALLRDKEIIKATGETTRLPAEDTGEFCINMQCRFRKREIGSKIRMKIMKVKDCYKT